MRINVRLNDTADADIIDALNNVKNVSYEIRRLLRKALGNNILINDIVESTPKNKVSIKTSKPKTLEEIENTLANISFGFDDD